MVTTAAVLVMKAELHQLPGQIQEEVHPHWNPMSETCFHQILEGF